MIDVITPDVTGWLLPVTVSPSMCAKRRTGPQVATVDRLFVKTMFWRRARSITVRIGSTDDVLPLIVIPLTTEPDAPFPDTNEFDQLPKVLLMNLTLLAPSALLF